MNVPKRFDFSNIFEHKDDWLGANLDKYQLSSMSRSELATIEYTVSQCTDTTNFIFTIKQGGFKTTFEIYNSLLAQLAYDLQMI